MKKMPLLTLLIPIVSLLFNKSNPLLPILVEKNITLDSYMGLWHQVGTSESTTLFGTGPKFTKVSAFYNVIKSQPNTTNISVFNFGFDTHGSFTEIHGFSYSEPNELPTKRKVKFDGLFFEGSYWIVKLGPIKNDYYQYAIISGPLTSFVGTRFSLYVLARNRSEYNNTYKNEVKDWCNSHGFIFPWNKYIDTY